MIEIRLEPTNNKKILKFVTNKTLTSGSYEFNNVDEAKSSPVAQKLFYMPFVKTVYITANFIAIERYDIAEWEDIADTVKDELLSLLNEYPDVIVTDEPSKPKAVSVYLEMTPNPNVMKLVSNSILMEGSIEFKNKEQANISPLATELFKIGKVKEIFISDNYISVTKIEEASWEEISMELRIETTEFLRKGIKVLTEDAQLKKVSLADDDSEMKSDDEIEKQTPHIPEFEHLGALEQKMVSILEEYIKPAVASDGGNISFIAYLAESKTVQVLLQGACSGCPSSTATLKNGVESIFKQMMPNEVKQIEAING